MSKSKTNVKFGFWGWSLLLIAIGLITGGNDGLLSNILIGLFIVAFLFRKKMYAAMERSNEKADEDEALRNVEADLDRAMRENPVIKREPEET